MLQIVILAGIALFLVIQLRRVLGTRDGFEPPKGVEPRSGPRGDNDQRSFEVIDGGGVDHDIASLVDPESEDGKALAGMKSVEQEFSATEFAGGARSAYEMILMAFENGDISEVRDFLSPQVAESFQGAIDQRADDGLTIDASFIGVSEVRVRGAEFDEATREAEITLKFVGELSSVVRDMEGDIVEGDPNEIKRQTDIWTFARTMGSDDPNWTLVATGA